MTDDDLLLLHNWLHDVNNRLGTILAASEFLLLEKPSATAADRSRLIAAKAMEVRDIVRRISDHFAASPGQP